jgi:hypothetical protein
MIYSTFVVYFYKDKQKRVQGGTTELGIWWQRFWFDEVPIEGAVRFGGDASAMSKSVPILWRFMQDWHCLQVGSVGTGEFSDGYHLFFTNSDNSDDGYVMKYRSLLYARFIMVREGPEPVRFFITDSIFARTGELLKTGIMVPGNRYRRNISRNGETLSDLKQKATGSIVWV